MPRARNIKPALFKNEILGVEDPLLTLLFEGLWCLADREGRLEDRPLRIKGEIFPYRDGLDVNGYLTDLERLGFIHRYTVNDLAIIQVITFGDHQRPHKTEKASVLPEKPENKGSQAITVKEPLNNKQNTSKNALIPDSSNTDTGSLNPDSLIPENKTTGVVSFSASQFSESQIIKNPVDWIAFFMNEYGYSQNEARNQKSTAMYRNWVKSDVSTDEARQAMADFVNWKSEQPTYPSGLSKFVVSMRNENKNQVKLQAAKKTNNAALVAKMFGDDLPSDESVIDGEVVL